MADFDLTELTKLLSQSPGLDRDARSYEETLFEEAKAELLLQFNNHPVTKEIEAGPDSDNISGTLAGHGNLYSFIGFPANENPIGVVRQILIESLAMRNPRKQLGEGTIIYSFPIDLPIDEIVEATPLPFESGNSWVVGIEEGISGFSNFLYKVSKASRAGKGIETKNTVLGGNFQPTPYLINMLSHFVELLGNNNFTFE